MFCLNTAILTVGSSSTSHLFLSRPIFAPLLFPNESSDARDHCANERTFLSWLRLSIYMSVVSVAIIISFHLKSQPTSVEKRIALPVGLIFWLLSIACLASGVANYVKTVTKYSRRQALVQSGWKTQVVSIFLHSMQKKPTSRSFPSLMVNLQVFTIVACAIVAACILLLSTNAASSR